MKNYLVYQTKKDSLTMCSMIKCETEDDAIELVNKSFKKYYPEKENIIKEISLFRTLSNAYSSQSGHYDYDGNTYHIYLEESPLLDEYRNSLDLIEP